MKTIKFKVTGADLLDLLTVTNAFTWKGTEDIHLQILIEIMLVLKERYTSLLKAPKKVYSLVMNNAEALGFFQFWQMHDTWQYKRATVVILDIIKQIDKQKKRDQVLQHS
jgi:hypothetical protein